MRADNWLIIELFVITIVVLTVISIGSKLAAIFFIDLHENVVVVFQTVEYLLVS